VDSISTSIQDYQLTVSALLRHGSAVHSRSKIVCYDGGAKTCVRQFSAAASRMAQLGWALKRAGVADGDRVGCMCWNSAAHLEVYFAVPAIGAVLHSINARLSDDQLLFVINDAADSVIIVDADLLVRLRPLLGRLKTVHTVVVVDPRGAANETIIATRAEWPSSDGARVLDYEEFIGDHPVGYDWADLDEHAAASICYTTGTTGHPKGVVYSHRSIWLHALTISTGSALAVSQYDSVLQVTPMFHVNGWGLPYAAWMMGADLILPGRDVSPRALASIIEDAQPTIAVGVPVIWSELQKHAEKHPVRMSSLRLIACAGSSVPESLIDKFEREHSVRLVQGWGMTEVSPWGGLSFPHKDERDSAEKPWRKWSGRVLPGLEIRAIDPEGRDVPHDGRTPGEMLIRGPWVAGGYHGRSQRDDNFVDGWLRTGDICVIDDRGYFKVTDRAKDIIKSGGEWISTVALEDLLSGHPSIAAAAVIGIPDDRWDERPLAILVSTVPGNANPEELRDFLRGNVPNWWIPSDFVYVDELPRTGAGKLDKKKLRAMYAYHRTGLSAVQESPEGGAPGFRDHPTTVSDAGRGADPRKRRRDQGGAAAESPKHTDEHEHRGTD
jgi:fatty-acyl-CoA synthase